MQERQHRAEILKLKEEMAGMQKIIGEQNTKMEGFMKHMERIRAKESTSLDAKREAELAAGELRRRSEELRLQVVSAEAAREVEREAREIANAKINHLEQRIAKTAVLAAQALSAKDTKVDQLRHRCAVISGRIGGQRSKARAPADLAEMPKETAQERHKYRSAKHRIVAKLAAALKEAANEPELIAGALTRAGVMQALLKKSRLGLGWGRTCCTATASSSLKLSRTSGTTTSQRSSKLTSA